MLLTDRPRRLTLMAAALASSALLSACDTLDEWSAEEYQHKCESLGMLPAFSLSALVQTGQRGGLLTLEGQAFTRRRASSWSAWLRLA